MNALEEALGNGLSSESELLAGKRLALCQRCDRFTGGDCPEHPGTRLFGLLLDLGQRCPHWISGYDPVHVAAAIAHVGSRQQKARELAARVYALLLGSRPEAGGAARAQVETEIEAALKEAEHPE